jgi:hypothetical protein
LIDTESINP